MGAAALLVFFPPELGMAIYNQPIGLMLQLLGIMCPFIYMQIILSGVLNGLGCQLFIFRNSIISSAITIAFTFFAVPHFGLPAYIFGWLLSLVVVIALGMHKIRQHIEFELPFTSWLVKPLAAAAIAGVLARVLANRLFMDALGLRFGVAAAISVLAVVYLWGILLSGCITKAEVKGLFTR
jgi:stage V sporulation protein B